VRLEFGRAHHAPYVVPSVVVVNGHLMTGLWWWTPAGARWASRRKKQLSAYLADPSLGQRGNWDQDQVDLHLRPSSALKRGMR